MTPQFEAWWNEFELELEQFERPLGKEIAMSAWRNCAERALPCAVRAAFETAAELCDQRALHHHRMGAQTLLKENELMAMAIRSMKEGFRGPKKG
jgi:hypothetical protein